MRRRSELNNAIFQFIPLTFCFSQTGVKFKHQPIHSQDIIHKIFSGKLKTVATFSI